MNLLDERLRQGARAEPGTQIVCEVQRSEDLATALADDLIIREDDAAIESLLLCLQKIQTDLP